jgi:hypothetical protein
MEKLHFPMVHFRFFLLQILSLLLLSSAQTLPTKFFVKCGSTSDVTVSGRNFVGDLNGGSGPSSIIGPSSAVSAINSSTNTSLYQTARIFREPSSSYEFDVSDHGIYYVRLHFFPFKSGNTNLANALFNVSTSNFSLLSNFGVKENSGSPAVIEEFLLTINESKFSIYFTPQINSFAFVNAIEVFLIPDKDFVMDDFPVINPAGRNEIYVGVRSQVLRTLHRVNVGGPQNTDILWRTWTPDDGHILYPGSAKTCDPYDGVPRYDVLGATLYSASDIVYNTCKELSSNSSVITWRFDVGKNARHLLRMHFCDIVSTRAAVVKFDAFIYSNFSQIIYPDDPFNKVEQLSAPFYWDFLVDSDALGLITVTIGPRQDSKNKNAYLNGMEILEFSKELV